MNKTRQKIHDIIYEADTPAGKVFDISLIIVIIISVVLVALETVGWINQQYYEINPQNKNEYRTLFINMNGLSGKPQIRYLTNYVAGTPPEHMKAIHLADENITFSIGKLYI